MIDWAPANDLLRAELSSLRLLGKNRRELSARNRLARLLKQIGKAAEAPPLIPEKETRGEDAAIKLG